MYPLGSTIGLPADELAPITATTTFVSAGDAGANNFGALKHYIIGQVRSRIYAFVAKLLRLYFRCLYDFGHSRQIGF